MLLIKYLQFEKKIKLAIFSCLGLSLIFLGSFSYGAKPNVVFVFADQMRNAAMSVSGNTMVKTPHLDAMAKQGFISRNAYSNTPVCTPYRAQLMTGRHFWHTGVGENDVLLKPEEYSLAEAFNDNGYSTGFIGKWHLSAGRRAKSGTLEAQGWVAPENRQGFKYWAAKEVTHDYFDPTYFTDVDKKVYAKGYEPELQTNLAIEFMKAQANNPFLLVLSYGPPHNPYKPPPAYDMYDPAKVPLRPNVPINLAEGIRQDIADYYGLVTSLDDQMGRLMDAMETMNLTKNTILVFSSDHGDMLASHGYDLKQKPWQEAANTPFIIRYPGVIPAGQESDLFVGSIDFMPTLLGLAGLPIPKNMDGVNLTLPLTDSTAFKPPYLLMANNGTGRNSPGWAWRALREGDYKYSLHSDGGWFLHNLKDDPYEMNNLIDDPKFKDIYARMDAVIKELMLREGDNTKMGAVEDPPVHSEPAAYTITAGCTDPAFKEYDSKFNFHERRDCKTLKSVSVSNPKQMSNKPVLRLRHRFFSVAGEVSYSFKMMNTQGKVLFEGEASDHDFVEFPTSIPEGIYLVHIQTQTSNTTQKVYLAAH